MHGGTEDIKDSGLSYRQLSRSGKGQKMRGTEGRMHGGTEEKTNQLPHPKGMRLPLHITKSGKAEGWKEKQR
jgi:hypothetical protein